MTLEAFFQSLDRTSKTVERVVIDKFAATTPWLGPLPSAYMVFEAMQVHLGFPFGIALAGAATVEFLGLATIHTALSFWNDLSLRSAKTWLAFGTGVFYIAVVMTFNVVMDAGSQAHKFAKGLLTLVAVVGALTIALRAMQAKHEAHTQQTAQAEAARLALQAETLRLEHEARLATERLRLEHEAQLAAERLRLEQETARAEREAERQAKLAVQLERLKLQAERQRASAPAGQAFAPAADRPAPKTYAEFVAWMNAQNGSRPTTQAEARERLNVSRSSLNGWWQTYHAAPAHAAPTVEPLPN